MCADKGVCESGEYDPRFLCPDSANMCESLFGSYRCACRDGFSKTSSNFDKAGIQIDVCEENAQMNGTEDKGNSTFKENSLQGLLLLFACIGLIILILVMIIVLVLLIICRCNLSMNRNMQILCKNKKDSSV